jgi:hypothetical protein
MVLAVTRFGPPLPALPQVTVTGDRLNFHQFLAQFELVTGMVSRYAVTLFCAVA